MSWLTDLLQGIPLNAILREKMSLAEQRIKETESENNELREKNESLRIEIKSLKSQVEQFGLSLEYTEERGVLWKRRPDGIFHQQPYCPACKLGMTKDTPFIISGCEPRYRFKCQKCKFHSDVYVSEAPDIIAGLK